MAQFKISKKHHKHLNNPFPPPPKSLPFINGSLSFNPDKHSNHQTFQIGEDFLLSWSSSNGGHLSISHQSEPNRSLWSSINGEAFISASAAHTEVGESRGSFVIKDGGALFTSNHQSIDEVRTFSQSDLEIKDEDDEPSIKIAPFHHFKGTHFPILLITGLVSSKKERATTKKLILGAARYWVLLDQKNSSQIGFHVKFGEFVRQRRSPRNSMGSPKRFRFPRWRWRWIQHRWHRFGRFGSSRGYLVISSEDEREGEETVELAEFNRVVITYSSDRDEKFYGFGEQFSHMEFKGRRVPILVQEQGIGRGDQPITFAANLISYRSGGDWSTTYAPSPFYMTSKMRSVYLEGYNYSVFDLTKSDRVQIQIHGNSAQGRMLKGNSPTELIESFTETIGRPPVLPNWIISGAVVGMQGGTEAVRRIWDQLRDYDIPISAFWLQDWVGQRQTIIGSQLWWNWELDTTRYVGWKELIDDLHAHDIRVMTYCNPCLVPTDEKPNRNKNLFEDARSLDILVKDQNGATYLIPNTAFDVAMLDLTHPKASDWFKKVLHEMVNCGARGWMADFGEGLPLDAKLYSGEDPIAAHNRYPELWARINREFVDEWRSNCRQEEREDPEEGLVFFMRAGFRESPRWTMLMWEGDQMVSWQKNDGIKSSITGLLSGGLSGFPFNHSDIGGYCAVDLPILRYRRSEELLMRWMELNAFGTVFRTHEGNKPSSNCQFYSNGSTLAHFARFAKVYKAWEFYRIQLVKEAAQKGLPLARHLFLHYPNDDLVKNLTYQQFLVGTEILVVPVLDKGKKEVRAYFPRGSSWQHIWTRKIFSNPLDIGGHNEQGVEAWVEAPIGYPAVFVKFGSSIGETFLKNLKDLNIL